MASSQERRSTHQGHVSAEAEEAVGDDDMSTISKESKSQLRELLAKLQSQLPGSVVQDAWSKLSSDEQLALSQL